MEGDEIICKRCGKAIEPVVDDAVHIDALGWDFHERCCPSSVQEAIDGKLADAIADVRRWGRDTGIIRIGADHDSRGPGAPTT